MTGVSEWTTPVIVYDVIAAVGAVGTVLGVWRAGSIAKEARSDAKASQEREFEFQKTVRAEKDAAADRNVGYIVNFASAKAANIIAQDEQWVAEARASEEYFKPPANEWTMGYGGLIDEFNAFLPLAISIAPNPEIQTELEGLSRDLQPQTFSPGTTREMAINRVEARIGMVKYRIQNLIALRN